MKLVSLNLMSETDLQKKIQTNEPKKQAATKDFFLHFCTSVLSKDIGF